jgi:septal ring-binding cell division protein DamX
MTTTKRKIKKKPDSKTYKIELSRLAALLWSIFLFFLLSWIFVLGILVGRDSIPKSVSTIANLRNQITKLQERTGNEEPLQYEDKTDSLESAPKLEFYEQLSTKKEEAKKQSNKQTSRNNIVKQSTPETKPVYAIKNTKTTTVKLAPLPSSIQYTVQLASLGDKGRAEKLIKELAEKGIKAYFYEALVNGKKYYRVRCGKFFTREAAGDYALAIADKEGINGFVSRVD